MKTRINQFIVFLLLVSVVAGSCSMQRKSRGAKFCGCPNVK